MRKLFATLFAACALVASAQEWQILVDESQEPMATGKFEPTWESLRGYEFPEWFRDAKFGIWAHWGPQCVEGSGDWMAREMYIEGSKAYKFHRENYGHQSEFGFKDVLPLFKAERWNPDSLVNFYKEVGAKYFFALGNHHDNFDLWDSKYQPWNSMAIGPHRDILGEWAAAAEKAGLPLGISFHADHAWTWYEPSRRYDLKGDRIGDFYDGVMTKEDGKGKWWEGLDPQDLYAQNHEPSKGSWSNELCGEQWGWLNGAATPSQEFVDRFYNRTLDAINRYNPTLIYFDVTVLPFYPVSDAGMKIATHQYNHYMATHNGRNDAVCFGKILEDDMKTALIWDVERGAPNQIVDHPWQSCSCLGNWHYNTSYYEKDRYKDAPTVAKLLLDVVSKNGNLLLSVPLRGDGTFDEKEEAILREFGAWMKINGEAIYGTRPWRVFGEGPIAGSVIEIKDQGFNEGSYATATAEEIRFTTKGKYLYAAALAWPEDHKVTVRSLAGDKVRSVELLGHGKVRHEMTADGLVVYLPDEPLNRIAPVLKIRTK